MSHRFSYTDSPDVSGNDWGNIKTLMPFLWEYKGRVLFALLSLIVAKFANVGVPVVLKGIVDGLSVDLHEVIVLPVLLLFAYGALRIASSFFNELRDVLFTRVRYRAMRRLTIRTMQHLHDLSLRFHLERKTGAISRDLQRGATSLSNLLNYFTFSIIPILVEFTLVAAYLLSQYSWGFTVIIFGCVSAYVIFTMLVMNWRMEHRQAMNKHESNANNIAIDSLINYETVKYFNNEQLEIDRTDEHLHKWEDSGVTTQTSMSLLNFGQGAIIAIGVTIVMFFASNEVVEGKMTIGDLVLVNAFLLQLFIPLGFLGIVYRQIRYALTDMDNLVKLLNVKPEIVDNKNATDLRVGAGEVIFENVNFSYNPDRKILHDVSFSIGAGEKVAIVGPSGAGKSTLGRLLFRFYDVNDGKICIDGQDLREVTQQSLRENIGIVPQDTVLFNESIYFNLQYAAPDASEAEIYAAAKQANLHNFILQLPQGYETMVGERGLKLSGGEKQRVAIARVILKKPKILIFDEATSALDTHSEQAILESLKETAQNHTTMVIAHRLSTIVDADRILVLDAGRIIEQGSHRALLGSNGRYAEMWQMQLKESADQ
ncbi:MAG: ABC transporter ATP-binding protein/permease [Gammaproteobacteria bacterium]|nr:ABC transporter ATP-binding protein/permease [Gammaproteobacteria bacterium]